MRIPIFLFAVLFGGMLNAQNHTISGHVKDGATGEDLIGAQVVVNDGSGRGALSNPYGFYSLTLPAGTHQMKIRYAGYVDIDTTIELQSDVVLDVELFIPMQKEVVIVADSEEEEVGAPTPGKIRIDPSKLKAVPLLFGERDPVKLVQFTPGVKAAGEGNSGFYVRGGGLDQNLILLDEAPVYNASHLLGFFSVFNGDAIKDLTLYKGGIPAQYGGRGSSVLDIIMKDGNSKKFGVEAGIGTISSKATIEGPIVKDKGSFIVSGRRTYADIFLKLSKDENLKNTTLFFYDLNLKANYKLGDKDRIYASGYFGRDVFEFGDQFGFNWGNATGTLRWNHIYGSKLFSNTSVIFSNYDYEFSFSPGDESVGIKSSIQDWNVKQDYSWFANSNNNVKFGVQGIYHKFLPGKVESSGGSFNSITTDDKYALEGGVYIQNDQKFGKLIQAQYGIRYSIFNYMGEGTAYTFNSDGDVLTEQDYGSWESIQTYHGIEPRVAVSVQMNEESAIKTSYNRNYQYLHLLSNSVSSSPTDVWVPASNNVKPQIVDQVSLGYFRTFKKGKYSASIDTYYKWLDNQIDYKNGADLILNNTIESELVYGKGRSFGVELMVEKKKGRFTGWVSYTLSRTLRQFDEINGGEEFSARQDRIHDVSVVGMFEVNDKITLSANFIYYTGDAVTFPSGRYIVDGQIVPLYTDRNAARMPDYHRLDLGFLWKFAKAKKFEHSLNISVYNVYARENAYSISFRQNADDPTKTEAVQLSLFRIIPSITYNIKF